MVSGEREMVRREGDDEAAEGAQVERFTSLQATYEDSVPPAEESDWEYEG